MITFTPTGAMGVSYNQRLSETLGRQIVMYVLLIVSSCSMSWWLVALGGTTDALEILDPLLLSPL